MVHRVQARLPGYLRCLTILTMFPYILLVKGIGIGWTFCPRQWMLLVERMVALKYG